MGALALFGEKYGNEVRVVEIGDYSRELCGGTHVARSGQLGLIKVLGEASIGAGVRRVEALVGIDAFRFLAKESVLVSQLTEQLKVQRGELPERISGIVTRLRDAEKDLERVRSRQVLAIAGELAAAADDDRTASPTSPTRRRSAPAPTTSAGSRSTSGAGSPAGRAWSSSQVCPRTARSWWSRSTSRRAAAA